MLKKILILGAGIYQVPLILKAKEYGIKTIVASRKGKYPGFQIADKIEGIDTTDIKKILHIAKKHKINGAVTSGTDVAMPALGIINDTLKLNGISFAAALNTSDKARMKKILYKNQVPTPEFCKIKDIRQAKKSALMLRYPLVIQPVDSSGSRGISVIFSEKEIPKAFSKARKFSKQKTIIMSKYLKGKEFGAQAFIHRGHIKFILIHNDTVSPLPIPTPIGHSFPSRLSKHYIKLAKNIIKKAINSMELDNCLINIDLILHKQKPYILEIAGRSGATCLPEIIKTSYSIDLYDIIIKVALGEKPLYKIRKNPVPSACSLLRAKKSGIIKNIAISDISKRNLIKIAFDVTTGDKVKKFLTGPDRIGEIIVTGKNAISAEKIVKNAEKKLKIDIV